MPITEHVIQVVLQVAQAEEAESKYLPDAHVHLPDTITCVAYGQVVQTEIDEQVAHDESQATQILLALL